MKMLAKIVSVVFGLPWIPVLIYVVVMQEDATFQKQMVLLLSIALLVMVIPLFYFVQKLKSGKISDFDITHREQRYGVMMLLLAMSTLVLGEAYLFNATAVFNYFLILIAVLAVNTVITHYWKISLHMGVNIMSVLVLNSLFEWRYMWLFVVIPLIYWSRYTLHRHTHAQLIGGFIVTGGVTLVGLRLLGLV